MKQFFLILATAILSITLLAQTPEVSTRNTVVENSTGINFIVTSDMGRAGFSKQRNIAAILGRFAEENRIDFLAVAGDPIHYNGVKSVTDKEWKRKIENVYTAASLHSMPWYVVSGNHEYIGNVQAILDYSNVSERWNAPARYFSFTKQIGEMGENCLFIFIDTTPLIDKYRNRHGHDAGKQDMDAQLDWIKNELSTSNAKWKIVIGHHPVYAKTTKEISERTDMQKRVGVLLEEYGADLYICGHIHNFQYIKPPESTIRYIVNSSASRSRRVYEKDETAGMIFGNSDAGFSVFSVSTDSIDFFFVNHKGEKIYSQTIK